MLSLLALVVILALTFDFINGFHDTANAIATSVSTRVLSPSKAILMAAVLNFFGALTSTGVATTIGKGIVAPELINNEVLIAGLVGAITWNLITWYYGLPSSSSHALIGGVIGGVAAGKGLSVLNVRGIVEKIFLPLVVSPIIGFFVSYFFMITLIWIVHRLTPYTINKYFSKLQVLSAAFMAFSHGSNDAQKSMGIITAALVSAGVLSSFQVPKEVILACALAMALGTSVGGWRIIKTIGSRIIRLEPFDGFAAESSSALVIIGASALHLPVSTTHVISSAIMGTGATRRLSAVRWRVARDIVLAWIFTAPMSALIAVLFYKAMTLIFAP
ncbi:MAG: inorganic phosphate transporter, PiT family [Eubacteriales bacterium]|nr:inorganic phosphate transporter, PiT family [Eubacteriales bacterium]